MAEVRDDTKQQAERHARLLQRDIASFHPGITMRELFVRADLVKSWIQDVIHAYTDVPKNRREEWASAMTNLQTVLENLEQVREAVEAKGLLDMKIPEEKLTEFAKFFEPVQRIIEEEHKETKHKAEDKRQEAEKEALRREHVRHQLNSSFPVLQEETDLPLGLQLCIKCRQSGHSISGCSMLGDDQAPKVTVPDLKRMARNGLKALPRPKQISLVLVPGRSPRTPCRRCNSIPFLNLFASGNTLPLLRKNLGWIASV